MSKVRKRNKARRGGEIRLGSGWRKGEQNEWETLLDEGHWKIKGKIITKHSSGLLWMDLFLQWFYTEKRKYLTFSGYSFVSVCLCRTKKNKEKKETWMQFS